MISGAHPVTLFSVPFHSAMASLDTHRLRAELGMTTHFHPTLPEGTASTGMARLDLFSGLFLVPGPGEEEWRIVCRSTRPPSGAIVHRWHVEASAAAHELDPAVEIPPRLAA